MDPRRILEIDRRFFEKYQRQLLWVFNTRIGRWFFRIHKDYPIETQFSRVFANAVQWENADGSSTIRIRTADKYANRLRYVLRHLVAIVSALSIEWVAKRQDVAAQFLFAGITMSFFPDPNPETTTVDGIAIQQYTSGSGQPWATIRAAAGTAASNNLTSGQIAGWVADNASTRWTLIFRSLFLFDTSVITSGATVSAASFIFSIINRLVPNPAQNAAGNRSDIYLVSSNPASNTSLTATDFSTVGSTSFGSLAYASATGGRRTITLNGSGLANITTSGISKFGLRIGADQLNTAPTWFSNEQNFYTAYFADNTGTASDPELSVTFNAITQNFTDTLSLSDASTVNRDYTYTTSDTLSLSDSQSNQKVLYRQFSDNLTLSDASSRQASLNRAFSDLLTLSDSSQNQITITRFFVDTITLVDSFTRNIALTRTFTEFLLLMDIRFNWSKRAKPSTIWSGRSINASAWSARSRPSSSWNPRTKPSSGWTGRTPPTTSWS